MTTSQICILLTIVVYLVAMVLVGILIRKKVLHKKAELICLAAIFGGGIGNAIDRIQHAYVVDMFEVQFMHFAIFNVADIFVVVGGILFCIYYLFLHDKKKEDAPHDPSV